MATVEDRLDELYLYHLRRRYRLKLLTRTGLIACAVTGGVAALATVFLRPDTPIGEWAVVAEIALLALGVGGFHFSSVGKDRAMVRKFTGTLETLQATSERLVGSFENATALQRTSAFVLAWNDFETVARAKIDRTRPQASAPASVVLALKTENLIDDREVRLLHLLMEWRNAVAHGVATDVAPSAFASLEDITTRLEAARVLNDVVRS